MSKPKNPTTRGTAQDSFVGASRLELVRRSFNGAVALKPNGQQSTPTAQPVQKVVSTPKPKK